MSDNELGDFLRTCRESVTPEEVGLPAGPRRRTPGLRRSELATLAGISVEYLTRLEQGRDRNPSGQVLGAIANALRIPYEQRVELRRLSKKASGMTYCLGAVPPARTVRPTVRALVNGFEPNAAIVINRVGEVLAHTSGYARLAEPVGLLEGDPPSLVRYVFTDPRARTTYPDWDRVADAQIDALRCAAAKDDPHVAAIADDLSVIAGPEFAERLNRPSRTPPRTGVLRFRHPDAGELRLAFETLDLPEADGQQIIVYLPADPATETALENLARPAPGPLRVVRG